MKGILDADIKCSLPPLFAHFFPSLPFAIIRFFFFFAYFCSRNRVSCILGWPQTHYNIELQILLLPPPLFPSHLPPPNPRAGITSMSYSVVLESKPGLDANWAGTLPAELHSQSLNRFNKNRKSAELGTGRSGEAQ